MDYSHGVKSGSSVHGILQTRILEWVAISFSRGSFWPRDRTWVFCLAGEFFTTLSSGNPREVQKPQDLWQYSWAISTVDSTEGRGRFLWKGDQRGDSEVRTGQAPAGGKKHESLLRERRGTWVWEGQLQSRIWLGGEEMSALSTVCAALLAQKGDPWLLGPLQSTDS